MTTKNISQISKIISEMEDSKDVEKFLVELLTQSELEDVEQRWNILKMLKDEKSQRNIAKALSVSLCKITRGAKILKNSKSIIRKILFDESWRG